MQRMVLAQGRADHQHAIELRRARRSSCPARARRRACRRREIATGAGGNRRCRCRGRARASAAGTVLRASSAATPARRSLARRAASRIALAVRRRRIPAPSASRPRASCRPRFTIGCVRRSLGVQAFVGEAVLVRQPAFVDRLVLAAAARASRGSASPAPSGWSPGRRAG